jgi:hypothetical protein
VYIHGGGFEYGNPLSWPFEHWIEQFPKTVIVSIYYRLSIFGFLSTPSKMKSGGIDFNAGFQDQLLALKWVRDVRSPVSADWLSLTTHRTLVHSAGTITESRLMARVREARLWSFICSRMAESKTFFNKPSLKVFTGQGSNGYLRPRCVLLPPH